MSIHPGVRVVRYAVTQTAGYTPQKNAPKKRNPKPRVTPGYTNAVEHKTAGQAGQKRNPKKWVTPGYTNHRVSVTPLPPPHRGAEGLHPAGYKAENA